MLATPLLQPPPIGRGSQLLPARPHVHEIAVWCQAAMTCEEVIDFEELLSELITMARMLRPHLGSRLISALLTYWVRQRPCLVRSDAGVDC